jgi:F0F1-type ATP synthase membrane subunit c/vacuolar-type H+-ATPase subunit K
MKLKPQIWLFIAIVSTVAIIVLAVLLLVLNL